MQSFKEDLAHAILLVGFMIGFIATAGSFYCGLFIWIVTFIIFWCLSY